MIPSPNVPLKEHPNPYFERKSYLSLNGPWDFEITKSPKRPSSYSKEIIVPFAVETKASGIGQRVNKDDYLHYRRTVHIPDEMEGDILLLHFTFVDQIAEVYFNGRLLGKHEGGYLPFCFEIPEYEKENLLEVIVKDDTDSSIYPRGKQSNRPKGIWYTPTSGIYGPVYLESIPKAGHINKILISPHFNRKQFEVKLGLVGKKGEAKITLLHNGKIVSSTLIEKDQDGEYVTTVSAKDEKGECFPYSPESPELYDFEISYQDDVVYSHAGLRKYQAKTLGKFHVISINGKPTFVSALLDQGYWEDSGLTPMSYEDYEKDIHLAKKMGFNCLRKHIKLEIPRFYYLADKAGMLISQDFVNGGAKYKSWLIVLAPFFKLPIRDSMHRLLGRKEEKSRRFYLDCVKPTIEYLYNSASLFMWSPFNEGWGQFDSVSVTSMVSVIDSNRLIDSSSGWFDMGCGDFKSRHVYFRRARLHNDKVRILSLSEYGGYSMKVKGHMASKKTFGYKYFSSPEKLLKGLRKLFHKDIVGNIKRAGLSMAVLTQLSDVEGEVNGLVTFDRKVVKVESKYVRELNIEAKKAFDDKFT